MASPFLRTSDVAGIVGVHHNTVRLYEEKGFLPPIPRAPNGYRVFTLTHLEQMRLAHMALNTPWAGRDLRRSAIALVRTAATGDLDTALQQARDYLRTVQAEQAQAEAAVSFLDRWVRGDVMVSTRPTLRIGDAAKTLRVTTNMLRNWERDGLIEVPRDPHNGYRLYGALEIGRLRVIRSLLRAGYSTMSVLRMLLKLDAGLTQDLRQVLDTPRFDEDAVYAGDTWLSTLAFHEQNTRKILLQLGKMRRTCRTTIPSDPD